MNEQLQALDREIDQSLATLGQADAEALESLRVEMLGKKGRLTSVLRAMGTMDPQERPAFGQQVNQIRERLETALAQREQQLKAEQMEQRLAQEAIDVTIPGTHKQPGRLHPVQIVQRDLEDIFIGMGFTVAEGPEVEYDHYNFELLNLPKNHAARDMHDTFYFTPEILLRTHTSPVQARYMTTHQPPIRIVCPGRTYRADEVDASHSPIFHQMEGLVVDRGVRMSDLNGTLEQFAVQLYGPDTRTRLRPSFFPFTEPSAEMDVSCAVCKGTGCRTCKGTGWLEVMGCGMVHPQVLSMCGIDPDIYSGFAFGMGIDRIALTRYGITDMRLLFENDVRLLRQFV